MYEVEVFYSEFVFDFFSSGSLADANDTRKLSVGAHHACVIDEESVKCWGYNYHGPINVPPLKNPTAVSAGSSHTCALDDDGVKCWGYNKDGQTNVPPLKNPISVTAGVRHSCALDDDGVKCWGGNYDHQTTVPPLKNPIAISAGRYHACAIDDEGVKCWGSNESGQTSIPPLRIPTAISAGGGSTCAVNDEGVKCWGNNKHGQTNVPPLKYNPFSFFSFNRLENLLSRLARWSMPIRTSFFDSLRSFAGDNLMSNGISSSQLIHGRYALIALLEASIETGDSSDYTENVIPPYRSRMKVINEKTGIHGLDQVEDFPLTRLTTLKVMQASLSVMMEFLTGEDKAHIQDIIKLLGTAMTDVSNKQNITNSLTAIDTNEAIINKLTQSSKTQFLVLTLKTAQQWLNAKIKQESP